MGRTDFK
jgi:hypothetical protein